jgi:DNA repair exonuclease SbcCD ATPase subunit
MAPSPPEEDASAGSILRELIFNQYQAIVLGGTAVVSLIALNPLPLLVWLGSELVLLPVLDSGPLRRLVQRRKLANVRARAQAARERLVSGLTDANARRFAGMEHLCGLIEANYQSLTGISQAYLSEQRGKLDLILHGCLHRLMALQRYERMPVGRNAEEIEEEIADLERELERADLPERAAAAVRKNLELKRRLLASLAEVGGTVKTLLTELDSMESLLEVLHQNSIALRDPQAISEELDTIVRQSEDSERVVREMEALMRADGAGWYVDMEAAAVRPRADSAKTESKAGHTRRKVKGR